METETGCWCVFILTCGSLALPFDEDILSASFCLSCVCVCVCSQLDYNHISCIEDGAFRALRDLEVLWVPVYSVPPWALAEFHFIYFFTSGALIAEEYGTANIPVDLSNVALAPQVLERALCYSFGTGIHGWFKDELAAKFGLFSNVSYSFCNFTVKSLEEMWRLQRLNLHLSISGRSFYCVPP